MHKLNISQLRESNCFSFSIAIHLSFAAYFKYCQGRGSKLCWNIDSKADRSFSCVKSFYDEMHSPKTKYIMIINATKLHTMKSQNAMREEKKKPFSTFGQ